jgi:segregation and condensation protein A
VSFEVKLQQFAGPLQLLLDLIQREELPITDVSLAQVTEDYLKYLNAHDVPTEELADFLVVAAKLLLLKSQAILPMLPFEEEDPSTLAAQLRMYKEFVEASKKVEALMAEGRYMFARERMTLPIAPEEFQPPEGVNDAALAAAFGSLLKRLEPFFALSQTSMERVVSVQQRIGEIRDAILERSRLTFTEVVRGAKSKAEVVVSFLALLELVKQRLVRVLQGPSFGEIEITHVD